MYLHEYTNILNTYLFRNLKKSEESVLRTEKETGDNEKEIDDLTKTLTTLEEKATEVMNECKRAEVCVIPVYLFGENIVCKSYS